MMALLNIKSLAMLAWGFVNTTLLLAIGGELGWGERLQESVPEPVAYSPAPVEITIHPGFHLAPLKNTYAATVARPLFVPNRRPAPPAPPPPPPPPPTMQKGQFQLLGTIITDEMKSAIIKEISSGKERQVVEGYTINGLLLELVEPSRIVFSQYDDREELRLRIQRSAKPPAVPSQGQQAAPARSLAIPAHAGQSERPGPRIRAGGAPAGRIDPPAPIVAPPQTVEDRARNPLLKDFYK